MQLDDRWSSALQPDVWQEIQWAVINIAENDRWLALRQQITLGDLRQTEPRRLVGSVVRVELLLYQLAEFF